MADKLTPAQECAVELERFGRKGEGTKVKRDADEFVLQFVPRKKVDIVSRYIREAEQRGREERAEEIQAIRSAISPARLFLLADWIDIIDKKNGTVRDDDEVQRDLRRLANALSTPEAPHD